MFYAGDNSNELAGGNLTTNIAIIVDELEKQMKVDHIRNKAIRAGNANEFVDCILKK